MAEGQVAIRFSVEDEETVRAALQKLGADGEAALRRLDAAGRAPSQGLSALDKLVSGAKERVVGMAISVGAAGQALVALGPFGVAAAAGIYVLSQTLGKAQELAHALSGEAARMRDFAEAAGISTDQVQALTDAGAKLGRDPEQVQSFVERFTTQVAQLRRGQGDLLEQISRISGPLAKEIATAGSVAEAWDRVAQAYKKADDTGDIYTRNAISRAIGGQRGGLVAGGLLGATAKAGGIDALVEELQRAGALIDHELIYKLANLRREIDSNWADTKNIFATMFAEDVLEQANRFFHTLKGMAVEAARYVSAIRENAKPVPLEQKIETDQQIDALLKKKQQTESDLDFFSFKAGQKDNPWAFSDGLKVRQLTSDLQATNDQLDRLRQKRAALQITINKTVPNDVPLPSPKPDKIESSESLLNRPGGLRDQAAVLGSAITPAEQLRLRMIELNAAVEKNAELSGFAKRGLDAFTLAQAQTTVAARERLGIVSQEELAALRSRDLDDQQAKGFIQNAGERVRAEQLVAKEIKATMDAQQVRAAQFSGLKQIEVDAGNVNKQLDQMGSDLVGQTTSGLTDIAFSADGAGASLQRLEQSLARVALQMVVNATVGRLMSSVMQGIFGMITPMGGGINPGSIGGTGGGLGGLYDTGGYTGDFSRDRIAGLVHGQEFVVKASETARHRALLEAINAGRFPGYADGGYVGPPAPVNPIPYYLSPSSAPSRGGGDAPVTVSVVLNDHAGVTMEQTGQRRNGSNIELEFAVHQIVGKGLANGKYDAPMQRYGAHRQVPKR